MGKRIFFISSGVLQVFHHDGRLGEPISFRADEEGLTSFALYLEQPWKDPVYVLVDFVEEEFREEQIPHVMGADRQSLIRTRLTRLFRDATYSHAQFHGRSSEGRRDDRMLFAALIRPDLLAPWMGQLTKHRTPVAGIFSLPLISGQLLKLLKLDARYLLLVTLQSSGGLRQTYFQDGELKVSRLATLPDTSAQRFTASMLGEVERVRRYLNSLRMLPADEALEVYVLGTERVREEVQRHSPTSITARHHVIPLAEVARKVGITGEFNERFSDRIFAQLLARRPPANQYAPAAQTRYFKLHKLRRGLIAASVFLLMGGLAWSAATFVDGLGAIQDLAGAREQATFYRTRYENARARLPGTPTDPRNMQRVVEAVDALATFRITPVPLMQVLSIGLNGFPQVQLHELRWRTSNDPGAQVDNMEVSPVEARRAGEPPPETLALYQVAEVKARITGFDGDYRAALVMVRNFADQLRTIPGVEAVQVESMPLDIGPDASLKGDARAATGASASDAEFELRVAVRAAGGRV
jgi:hypothetical protein